MKLNHFYTRALAQVNILSFFNFRSMIFKIKHTFLWGISVCILSMGFVNAKPLQVVTTFSILEDITKNIGQDKIVVTSLIGRNQDAHAFEPSPTDFKKLTQADIFIMNGLGLEGWITRTIDASGFKGTTLIASEGVKTIHVGEAANHHHEDEQSNQKDSAAHDHGEYDPHIWQDPKNVMIIAKNIAGVLSQKDPENTAFFEANLAEYVTTLTALDRWAQAEFEKIDHKNRTVLMRHDAFGYLAHAYDFHIVPILGISPDKDPSAKDIAALGALVKAKNIRIAFSENIGDDRLVNALGKDFGIKAGGALLSDALTDAQGKGASYILFFKHNVETIIEGLNATTKK